MCCESQFEEVSYMLTHCRPPLTSIITHVQGTLVENIAIHIQVLWNVNCPGEAWVTYRPKIKIPVQASQRPLWLYTRWLSRLARFLTHFGSGEDSRLTDFHENPYKEIYMKVPSHYEFRKFNLDKPTRWRPILRFFTPAGSHPYYAHTRFASLLGLRRKLETKTNFCIV